MKIAFYHNLPSGGGKRAMLEMARGLASGHEIDEYTLTTSNKSFCDLTPFIQARFEYPFIPSRTFGSPLGRLNTAMRSIDFRRLDQLQRSIGEEIDKKKYDVVFVNHCHFTQSPLILNHLRTPTVYYCAEPPRFLYEPRVSRPYNQLSKFRMMLDRIDPFIQIFRRRMRILNEKAAQKATLVLTNSAFSRENLYRVFGVNARICYLGVNTDRFAKQDLAKKNFVISVGAAHPGKGFDFLVKSVGCLPEAIRPDIILVSNYAENNEKGYLNQIANEARVNLEFRSMVSDEELVQLYNQALLTVYTPIMEPFGFVPIESMACGTPVIGIREGGVRESVIHFRNGLLIDRDEDSFVNAYQTITSNPSLYQELSRNGLQDSVTLWKWETCIQNLEKFFVQAMELRHV